MKPIANIPLLLILAFPLIASCGSAAMSGQPAPALLTATDAQCRMQLNSAASELIGKPLTLADDAFIKNDMVMLTTVGQSASGRMTPPTIILRLLRSDQGCQLRLEGGERMVTLPACNCRALDSEKK